MLNRLKKYQHKLKSALNQALRSLTDFCKSYLPFTPRDEDNLSVLLSKERALLQKQSYTQVLAKLIKQIYVPSWLSLICVAFPLVLLYLYSQLSKPIPEIQAANLIAIHAGIGVMIFALVIFIAESLREESKDVSRVLLKESFLWPLVVAELIAFFSLFTERMNMGTVLQVVVVGLLTLASLWRIIDVLLSKKKFLEKRIELLKDRLQDCIQLSLSERLGNNILLREIASREMQLEIRLDMNSDNEPEYYYFKPNQLGTIKDINLEKLKEFTDIIDSANLKRSRAIVKSLSPWSKPDENNLIDTISSQEEDYYAPPCLLKKYLDVVDFKNQNLIGVDNKLLDNPAIKENLTYVFNQIFTIKDTYNFAEEVRSELSSVKDQFIRAIFNKQLGTIEDLLALYIEIADSFSKMMKDSLQGYEFASIYEEYQSLQGGWNELTWLALDVKQLFEKAIESHDKEIISQVSFLPMAIAQRGIEHGDYYLFQEFIDFPIHLYNYAAREPDINIRNTMVSKSWQFLKEMVELHVEPELRRAGKDKEQIHYIKDIAIHFYKNFQALLYAAFQNNDIQSFQSFLKAAQGLFKNFESSFYNPEIEVALEEIHTSKYEMFFGLQSMIFYSYKNEPTGRAKPFFDSLSQVLPTDLTDLTELFLRAHTLETTDFWGWWKWRFSSSSRHVDFTELLEKLYVVKAVLLLSNMPEKDMSQTLLPCNRDMSLMLSFPKEYKLISTLEDIIHHPKKWDTILPAVSTTKAEQFRSMLLFTNETYRSKHADEIRKRSISKAKLKKFKSTFLQAHTEFSEIREIFSNFDCFENKISAGNPHKVRRMGINTTMSKEIFMDSPDETHLDLAYTYGSDFALIENGSFMDIITPHCQRILPDDFSGTIASLKNQKDTLFILTVNSSLQRFCENINILEITKDEDEPPLNISCFDGFYHISSLKIPAFKITARHYDNLIFILDAQQLGKMIQYSPLNKEDEERELVSHFYHHIGSFSEDRHLTQKIILESPDWLKKIGNNFKQEQYLQERVWLQIYERFYFELDENFQGLMIDYSSSW